MKATKTASDICIFLITDRNATAVSAQAIASLEQRKYNQIVYLHAEDWSYVGSFNYDELRLLSE